MKKKVKENWNWTDQCFGSTYNALLINAAHFTKFKIASVEKDMKEATDMVIKTTTNSDIAIRIRRAWKCSFRDLTIRSRVNDISEETELKKIREGYGDWYLYAWANKEYQFVDWIFIDIHKLRASGLLEKNYNNIPNYDGTYFIAISKEALIETNCIVSQYETHHTNKLCEVIDFTKPDLILHRELGLVAKPGPSILLIQQLRKFWEYNKNANT